MASAKQDRINRLVYILERANSWVSSAVLAKMLNTSERTVRNYIAEINREGVQHIASSKEGYRLERSHSATPEDESRSLPANTHPAGGAQAPQKSVRDTRRDYVLSRLINADEPVSMFDLADELHISESTLSNSVMPEVRKLLAQFDIQAQTHGFATRLDGREQDKRRLLGHLATQGTNGYFTSTDTLQEMFPGLDVDGIMNKLVEICQHSELFLNNYALSNLLLHILVIIIRLKSNNELDERDDVIDATGLVGDFAQRDEIVRCANEFSRYFKDAFGCPIPEADYQQIVLLIALSVERYSYDELSFERLSSIMERPFVQAVSDIAKETADRYGIAPFDETFMLQFTLHMYNVYQRALYHVRYPNPLVHQIMSDFAPVYDMAVYFAHRFSTALGVDLGENEIGFIAFHIGAYLERSAAPADSVTCIVIVEQYHDFARQLVTDLEAALADGVAIIGVMSCDAYLASHPKSDVVITTIDVPVTSALKILIGPILTKQNLRKIQNKVAGVLEAKRRGQAHQFLRHVLRPELFARNVQLQGGPDAYIDYLGSLCLAGEFANEDFIRDVHLRERISSTAFTERLAIPHSIDTYAARSFIAVLHNDTSIPWGRHDVNFVLLIGIAREDMGYFRDVLDIIIELFSSVDDTMRLMQTDTFEEFLRAFTHDLG